MLIEFKVANYRSIRAEQTLSMVASNYSDELPQNLISCDHVPGLKGTKLVKAVALYGANASGKSNIVAALRFFAEFVRDSATKLQPGAPTGAQPFKLDPACLTEPSKFEITAVINGIRTLYGIEMTRERVTSEYLVAYPKGRPQVWFERDWDEKKEKYAWSKSTVHFKHDESLRKKTRANTAFLTTASQLNHERATQVWSAVSQGCVFLDLKRTIPDWDLLRELLGEPENQKTLLRLISNADLGIVNIGVTKPSGGKKEVKVESKFTGPFSTEEAEDLPALQEVSTRLAAMLEQSIEKALGTSRPQLFHRGKSDAPIAFNILGEESEGTIRYLELAAHWLYYSQRGNLFVIDEIETSLHPLLASSFLTNLFSRQNDVVTTQVLFTTHNPLLLDQTLLRRDQIWFTEKDQEGATRLYPLTDFKPRKDESLVKGYLAGRYGGIPFIPEGLKF